MAARHSTDRQTSQVDAPGRSPPGLRDSSIRLSRSASIEGLHEVSTLLYTDSVMADKGTKMTVHLDEVDPLTLRPLTRVKYTAAALKRAEKAVHRARLEHVDAIVA